MNRNRLSRDLYLALALSVVLLTTTAAARFHLSLTRSFPTADQVLAEAPDTIRLWFNQEPEMALAAIGLEGPGGKVEMGKAEETDDPNSFKARVLGEVTPGSYRVTWRAAGSDGHAIRGRYGFEVSAAGSR